MINPKDSDKFFCDLATPIQGETLSKFNKARSLIMDTLNSFTTSEESHRMISSTQPELIIKMSDGPDTDADSFFLLGRMHASIYPGEPDSLYGRKVFWLECAGYQYFWIGITYENLLRNLASALFHLPIF